LLAIGFDKATGKSAPIPVAWVSHTPEIATVDDNGTVTAVAPGAAVVSAVVDGVQETVTVNVAP
jgi:uncharacterized protein YjdB